MLTVSTVKNIFSKSVINLHKDQIYLTLIMDCVRKYILT